MGTSVVALLLACASFIAYDLFTFRGQMENNLKTLAEVLAAQSTASLSFEDPKAANESLSALQESPSIEDARLFTKSGKTLASYHKKDIPDYAMPARTPRSMGIAGNHVFVYQDVILDKEIIGTLYLSSNLEQLYSRLRNYVSIVCLVLGFSLLVALLISQNLQRLISGPILSLAALAQGVSRWKNYRVRAEKESGDEIGTLIDSFNDMLGQIEKRDAELIVERDRAEAATRAKSSFLANMSHEVRTPMNGIIGLTRLTLNTELTDVQREYLRGVSTSAESLLSLINEILDFSKIEAGALDFDEIPMSLRDVVHQSVKTLALRAHEKDLEVAYDIGPAGPDAVICDPLRLRQIIINLMGNSIKFTETGEVVVNVWVESRTEESAMLHFAIKDTGIGIPQDKQQVIFQAFAQADSSTTRNYGGTGLGLTISARLVERMEGRIWVESEVGKGSTFHFTARMRLQKEAVDRVLAERRLEDLRDLPVLVVDDNATNRKVLEQYLVGFQMRPTVVPSATEAIAALERAQAAGWRYGLILTDANMPQTDGFMLSETIRERKIHDGVTIMMLTSSHLAGDSAKCREVGINAFMTKPISQSDLWDTIIKAMGVRAASSPARTEATDRMRERLARSGGPFGEQNRPALPPLRVLVAEDNPINQTLVTVILKDWSHEVVLANDGLQALEAYQREPFDVILMDVQMPNCDGFEATARIRDIEKTRGGHIPIIGVTAHALKGDRERCIDAGMDGYVSKPIQEDDLQDALLKIVPAETVVQKRQAAAAVAPAAEPAAVTALEPTAAVEPAAAPATPAPVRAEPASPLDDKEVIDVEQCLQQLRGKRELLRRIIAQFFELYAQQMEDIGQAVASQDAHALNRAAHKFKGSLGNFAARRAFEAAYKLEMLGRDKNLAEAPAAFDVLRREVDALLPALKLLSTDDKAKV
jgi:signal transduction histidine kinase/CheY-like chemotaxis protein/HPt (histidine-containing phosphotransfer) domain-containing protein